MIYEKYHRQAHKYNIYDKKRKQVRSQRIHYLRTSSTSIGRSTILLLLLLLYLGL